MFKAVDPKTPLSQIEHHFLKIWKEKDVFARSVEKRKGKEKYVFFDGPPFANGLPHYGHIMANSLKDAVTRFYSMRGSYVPRINGWDCHGLPVEYEIEKELGLSGRKDIEKMGIEAFNTKCRESVFRYTEEWKTLLTRIARWVDMENSYATLDANYMESIWWVFKEIWNKKLIYQGHRSMHVCPRCVTPLSNFEVSLGYKEVTDLSATVKFRSKENPNRYFLAWTTTPWTLPGNTALAVGPTIDYVEVEQDGQTYILAKELVEKHFDLEGLALSETKKGKEFLNEEYEPLFDFYLKSDLPGLEKAFKVVAADFVSTEDGTGIVHIAGGYGEDDMNLVQKEGMPIIQHVDMNGCFKEEVTPWAGKFVKGQDHAITENLKERGLLFKKENYKHSYPHCWRCDTPLLNYATKAWFIRVTDIKDKLLKNNKKIHWQPEHLKEGRFGKWLESVRDWNISRNRFWGTPLPIWECESCGHQTCIGSMQELKEKTGRLPEREGEIDLHRPYIDDLTLPCEKCGSISRRISEVMDCWFESGAMPYAQLHYPFENREEFEKNFPADFIAEGLDQTRGWFYTLHVLATILFDKPAFKNVIVNGILLAADGEKLSKRKKNYPDPNVLFEEKGVDSVRMFLYTSSASLGEDVRFSEQTVEDLVRKFTLTLWNTYSFFVTYAKVDGFTPKENVPSSSNKLDLWILSELHTLLEEVTEAMEEYNLSKATRPFIGFVDHLSNWYIRRSRRRFWKSENDQDKNEAYQTLWTVLVTLSKALAPFTPFLADEIFTNLTGKESVHLEDWPKVEGSFIDPALNQEIEVARQIVNLGHALRARKKVRVRQPLQKLIIALPKTINPTILEEQKEVILEELNVKEMEILETADLIAERVALPDAKKLGPKYGKEVQNIITEAKAGHFEELENGFIKVLDYILEPGEVVLGYKGKEGVEVESEEGMVISLDFHLSPELLQEGLMREIIRHIQELRKEANYLVSDRIYALIKGPSEIEAAVLKYSDTIKEETLMVDLQVKGDFEGDIEKNIEIEGYSTQLAIRRA